MKESLRPSLKRDWKIEQEKIIKVLKSLKKEGSMQVAFKRMLEKIKEKSNG